MNKFISNNISAQIKYYEASLTQESIKHFRYSLALAALQ